MPTTITHALVGVGTGILLAPGPMPFSYYLLTAGLGLLPDLDVIAFPLGIPYQSRYGHRGISHSLPLAFACSLFFAWVLAGLFAPWWYMAVIFSCVVVGHSMLDALTDGGMGVAFFAPFTDRRFFFPWRPIRVSPIGMAVFSRWGWRALRSELVCVWIPLLILVSIAELLRHRV